MAAGKHGGYHDYELRDRESDVKVSRLEFGYRKEENGKADWGREDRGRDMRSKARVRHKDIREREVVNNGGRRSSFSKSDSGNCGADGAWFGHPIRGRDREPGELSSESGSDDVIDSGVRKDSQVVVVKVVENGILPSLEKKRKFSPIVWDRDDKEVGSASKLRTTSAGNSKAPPPVLSKAQSSGAVSDAGVDKSPDTSNCNLDSKSSSPPVEVAGSKGSPTYQASVSPVGLTSPVEVAGSKGSPTYPASISPVGLASSAGKEQVLGNGEGVYFVEDEDRLPTRNISSSRWAAGNNSPADEGEILEDNGTPKRRKQMQFSQLLDSRTPNRSLTPEPGDQKREISDRVRSRSSESDERGNRSKSLSGDDYPGNDSEKVDDMDVEEDQDGSDGDVGNSSGENESHEMSEAAGPPQRSVNMLLGCRSVDEFERLNKIDEGTYGVVYRAKDKKTGEIVALKKVKMEKEREGFPLTSLREINILLSFHHSSIVDVKEVVVGSSLDSIFMVMEYMEHDLKALMESMKQPFSQSEVKCLMLQLLEGVKYLHDNWVLHRDLKTSNLLLNNRGELKICDFGLARQYGSPLKPYTHLVVTLWYRAPELLLGAKLYSTAIDMWSLGCIMAELLSKEPLFNGKTEFDQLDKIFRILGTPNETIWPGFSKLPGVKVNFVKHQYNLLRQKFPATSFTGSPVLSDSGFNLLNSLLTYDPEKRISAEAALNHEWFREVPLPKSKEFMPTFPAQHAQDRRLRRVLKSPDPLEEQRRKELRGELGTGGLFG